MGKRLSSGRVIGTSFVVDFSDIVLSVIVALLSGSVVMLAEAVQGAADLLTSGLLLIGVRQSRQRADKEHAFGYGRAIYFWTLLAAVIMFAGTATLSIHYGWERFLNPHPITNLPLALLVLAIGFCSNSYALYLSALRLKNQEHSRSLLSALIVSDLIETKATFVLDLMGTTAAAFGLISLLAYHFTGNLRLDGLGAVLIGATIAVLAFWLIVEVRDLLIGRSARPETEAKIKNAVLKHLGVREVLDLRTMYIGAERLLVNIEVKLAPGLTTIKIEHLMDAIKVGVKQAVPSVHHVQIELES